MLYCPYMKQVQISETTGYKKFPGDGERDVIKETNIITSFGECVQNCCPFYWPSMKECRRAESEAKNGNI